MSIKFFSDRGINTPISDIYGQVGVGMNPQIMLLDAQERRSNNARRVIWAQRYERATGIRPSLNGMTEHRCASCRKPVWYPRGRNPDPYTVFCSDECSAEYKAFNR